MDKLDLKAKERIAYKVTTMRKHSHSVADNIVDQQFNPKQANQIWAGDVTYLIKLLLICCDTCPLDK